MITAAEIRDALEERYPEVTDLEFNIKHSGFAPRMAPGAASHVVRHSRRGLNPKTPG